MLPVFLLTLVFTYYNNVPSESGSLLSLVIPQNCSAPLNVPALSPFVMKCESELNNSNYVTFYAFEHPQDFIYTCSIGNYTSPQTDISTCSKTPAQTPTEIRQYLYGFSKNPNESAEWRTKIPFQKIVS